MSPRPEPPRRGGPSPRRRRTVPCEVPGLTRRVLRPLSVGTSTSAPHSASGMLRGTSTSTLSPLRLNTGDRLVEGDRDLGLEVLAALGPGLATAGARAASTAAPEQVGQDVAHARRVEVEVAKPAEAAAGTARERPGALVVLLALLRIGQ